MKAVRHKFQTEVHLGILALIFLLLFLNFTSNFLIFATRSSKRDAVATQLHEAVQAVGRLASECGRDRPGGENLSEIMRTYRLSSLEVLPSAPEDESTRSRRRWFRSVVDQFPPGMVPIIARQVIEAEPGELRRGEGVEFCLLESVLVAEGRAFVLLSRSEPELARLDDIYRLALIMSVIALIVTAAVYVILSRLIFAPFRKVKAEALTAGRTVDDDEDDVEALLSDYRLMIEELRQKEQELLRLNREISLRADSLEQFNRYLLASVQSGIVTVDEEGVIRTMNDAAGRILNVRGGEGSVRPYVDVLPAELADAIRITLTEGTGSGYREVAAAVEGRAAVLGISASVVFDGTGNQIGAALLINDATEITQLRGQLERRARLAALGEMSGGLAHQLRNSLGAIGGYLNLLRKRLQKQGIEEPAVDELVGEAAQAESLVRRFLEFARPLEVDPGPVDVRELVQQASASFGMRADYPDIEVEIGPLPGVTVQADPLLLRQVLVNLIENAANAYPDGRGVIVVDGQGGGGEVAIRVRDQGCGITPENLAQIFTPFFSSRPSGTGLGLPLVSKIVDLHKGRIEVDSRPGEGSTFTVILPLEATDESPVTESGAAVKSVV